MATTPSAHADVDERIRKRAIWESFSFEVPEPGRVIVVNHSYGVDPDKHAYTVTVENGRAVACTCLHFEHRKATCKHMVRVEQEPAVMAAASVSQELPITDGGVRALPQIEPEECENGNPGCPGPDSDDLPCFQCFCESENGQ